MPNWTPVPFDPEIVEALHKYLEPRRSSDPTNLEVTRSAVTAASPSTADIIAGKDILFEDRSIPGSPGQPDVVLTILRPKNGTGRDPVLYHIHGGGMISG